MSLPTRLPATGSDGSDPRRQGWLARRLSVTAVAFAPDTRVRPDLLWWSSVVVVGVLAGRIGGPVGSVVGLLFVGTVPVFGPAAARRRSLTLDRRRLPQRCASIARAVRVGESLPRAVMNATTSDELPTAIRWRTAMQQVELGRSFDEALGQLVAGAEDDERLVLAGLRIGASEGGAVAAATASLAGRLRHEVELTDRRRVLTTQARTSAQVMAGLPLVFLAVMASVRGVEAWTRPLGLVSLGLGGAVNGLGIVWMRRLIGRLR